MRQQQHRDWAGPTGLARAIFLLRTPFLLFATVVQQRRVGPAERSELSGDDAHGGLDRPEGAEISTRAAGPHDESRANSQGAELLTQPPTPDRPISADANTKWYRQPAIAISFASTIIALFSLVNTLIYSRDQAIASKIQTIYNLADQAAKEIQAGQDEQAALDISHATHLVKDLGFETPPTVLRVIGDLVRSEGHFEDCKRYYEDAIRLSDDPFDKIVGFRCLGDLSLCLGEREAGRAYYRQALKVNDPHVVNNVDDAYTYGYWWRSESSSHGDPKLVQLQRSKAIEYLNSIGWKDLTGLFSDHQGTGGSRQQEQRAPRERLGPGPDVLQRP